MLINKSSKFKVKKYFTIFDKKIFYNIFSSIIRKVVFLRIKMFKGILILI